MAICSVMNCSFETVENRDKCILHCDKGEYSEDFRNGNFLSSFNESLIEYILNRIFEHDEESEFPTRVNLKVYLNGTDREHYRIEDVTNFIRSKSILFAEIKFPARESRDHFDYEKVLQKLGSIHFDRCEFYASSLELQNTEVFFQECTFINRWYLFNYNILGNVRDVIYQMCHFNNDVCTVSEDYSKPEFDKPIFSDCIFDKELSFENMKLNSLVFSNTEYKKLVLKKITFNNVIIEDKFTLNNYEIDEFYCYNSEFNNEIGLKNNTVNKIEVDNTSFHKLVDCFHSTFRKFNFKESVFEDFVGFENCVFGDSTQSKNEEFLAVIKYTTFLSFVNFRYSEFKSGLDIVHINLKEPPNFLNINLTPDITPRETYRIIKNSFDGIANYIEGNKYYEMEMLKLKEETKVQKKRSAYILLLAYEFTSNYGQSYLRPLGLTILFSLIYWLCIYSYDNGFIHGIYPPINPFLGKVVDFFNGIARHIMPFSKILKEGTESVSLVFYLFFTSFIWLIILAIKRNTKR